MQLVTFNQMNTWITTVKNLPRNMLESAAAQRERCWYERTVMGSVSSFPNMRSNVTTAVTLRAPTAGQGPLELRNLHSRGTLLLPPSISPQRVSTRSAVNRSGHRWSAECCTSATPGRVGPGEVEGLKWRREREQRARGAGIRWTKHRQAESWANRAVWLVITW